MDSTHSSDTILIRGVTRSGRRFRPSDWAERLSTLSASFVGGRIRYHPYVQMRTVDGVKGLQVDRRYAQQDPGGFAHILAFARGNDLVVEGLEADVVEAGAVPDLEGGHRRSA